MHELKRRESALKLYTNSADVLALPHPDSIDSFSQNHAAFDALFEQATTEQLPYIGELIEVKDSELVWEGAIERIAHSFAISMLVPQNHYARVAKWINENSLGMKLVYFYVDPSKKYNDAPVCRADSVAKKFDHICCDNIAMFQNEVRAITKAGQIKSNTHHEKDDRRDIHDRTNYVLGFSNQKKVLALEENIKTLDEELSLFIRRKETADNSLERIRKQLTAISALQSIVDYETVDCKTVKADITALEKRIYEIENSNDRLMASKAQLDTLKAAQLNQQTVIKHKMMR